MKRWNKKAVRISIVLILIAVYIIIMKQVNEFEFTDLVSTTGRSFEKAVVTEITQDNLGENGVRSGYQQLVVYVTNGDHKGQELEATSAEGNLFGAVCKTGDKVIVIVTSAGDTSTVSVYSQDREGVIFAFIVIFLLAICIIGGKNGIKSVAALVFTFVSILYLFMPLIYRGVSPFFAAIIVAVLTTIVTMYLIGGVSFKTISAIIGTTLGVLISGISALLFGYFAGIDGYNVSDIETLVFVGQNTNIKIGGLLFAGVLISSLGAVMDVAMSVSSTVSEIKQNSPSLEFKKLFFSGLQVGRDAMGTMSNTLILAFVGGSITTLVINYAYDLPYLQLINSYSIGIEIMQGIGGSIGVILTVPCVALVASLFACKKNR